MGQFFSEERFLARRRRQTAAKKQEKEWPTKGAKSAVRPAGVRTDAHSHVSAEGGGKSGALSPAITQRVSGLRELQSIWLELSESQRAALLVVAQQFLAAGKPPKP